MKTTMARIRWQILWRAAGACREQFKTGANIRVGIAPAADAVNRGADQNELATR